jgi:hypothetical protein
MYVIHCTRINICIFMLNILSSQSSWLSRWRQLNRYCLNDSCSLDLSLSLNWIIIINTIIIILWRLTLFYYQYVHCAMSVINVVAADLAH